MEYPPLLIYGTVVLFGLIIGSFLNVVIYRLPSQLKKNWKNQCLEFLDMEQEVPVKETIIWPGSHCPHCQQSIKPLHNIPLLGYLWLHGRCAPCNKNIALRYPFIEVLTALCFILAVWRFDLSAQGLSAAVLATVLIVLAFIDIDHQFLPDDITLPMLWIGLLLNVFDIHASLSSAVIGASAGYLTLWLVYQFFKRLTGKEGMGYGDFKLLAMLGAWLGWQALPLILLLSALAGSIIGVFQILVLRRDKNKPIPFGPYLALAGWVSLIWGDDIVHQYFAFIGF